MLRADSAYYGHNVIAVGRRAGVHFSVTARKDQAVTATIAAISEDAWTPTHYPRAVFDEQLGQWVSGAEVAEVAFTAFASRGTHIGGARSFRLAYGARFARTDIWVRVGCCPAAHRP